MARDERTRRTLVTALAVALLTGGCLGDEDVARPTEAATPTAVTTSALPSPTPTPTIDVATHPQRPDAMAMRGPDGAAAAASYFMTLYPYVLATGDLIEWDALSADTCDFCANTRSEVQRLQAAGQRSVGGVTVLSAEGRDLGGNDWFSADLFVRIDPSVDLNANGDVVGQHDGGDYVVNFALTWADGWVVDSAGIVKDPTG